MIKRSVEETEAFRAGDDTLIREILHPKNEQLELNYSLAHATLAAGERSRPHQLRHSSEVYFILAGQGLASIEGQEIPVKPGDLIFIPPGADQSISNTGDRPLTFLCVVSPPWKAEDEVVP